ncbi:Ig-like domain-containing protein, partial [Salmonella enterica subsp. enterica serovar Montevideo]|nr:Ig-like domain-containing protein [Salmonella enterica subsp. enterica serovar Montevideo]
NSSQTSGVFSVTLDTQPPAQPDAPLISDNVAPVIGNIGNNGATNDTTPTFSGTGEIGSTIILYNNGSEIGRTTVGDNGSWNFTPAALTPETYTITVTETDIAGNISPPSASAIRKTHVLAVNGEIYNHQTLRAEYGDRYAFQ